MKVTGLLPALIQFSSLLLKKQKSTALAVIAETDDTFAAVVFLEEHENSV
jgi:hypothetical protein